MRSVAAIALLALPLAAAAQSPRSHGDPICRGATARQADETGARARFRRLGDLPPANETLTLLRTEGGCSVPVTVRYGIGANTAAPVGHPQN